MTFDLLQFIYKGKVPELTLSEHTTDLLYIARKYSIRQLEEECCAHLSGCVTYVSVFETLEVASLYDLPALSLICWDYIQESTLEVLQYNINYIETEVLITILQNDHLNIPELALFKLVLQ